MRNILFIIVILFLSACGRDIDFEIPEHERRIVVNSMMEADSTFRIYVTKTRSTGNKESIEFLKDAEVDLYEDNVFTTRLTAYNTMLVDDTIYYFSSSVRPVIGKNYSINVRHKDLKEVESNTIIPSQVQITKVVLDEVVFDNATAGRTATATIHFKDPSPEKNYYHLKIYTVFEPPYSAAIAYTTADATATGAAYNPNGFDNSYMWDDIYFSGLEKEIKISLYAPTFESRYVVELRTVPKEYYLYQQSLYLQEQNNSDPFAEPINVYSNIKNGLGIFTGFSASRDTLFIPE